MANILNESVAVTVDAGLLRAEHVQLHDDGIDMGGSFVCDASAGGWLAAELERAADAWGYEELKYDLGPDHFTIYVAGNEYQPFVHVHNERDPAAPEGKLYTLGMTTDAARSFAAQLRNL